MTANFSFSSQPTSLLPRPLPFGKPVRVLPGPRYDLLIIGGGIVGAGVAREAAMQGMSVLLAEQSDFASGTSSRSSRLLHGGIRYLAQGRVGLVRQASREKCILGRIAPHLVEPLPLLLPSYRASAWPLWKAVLGVKLYDLLCSGENFGPSQRLSSAEFQAAVPGIQAHGLRGGVRYYDALTSDARLVLDTLRSAVWHGASVYNYLKVVDTSPIAGGGWRCLLHDGITQTPAEVRADAVVQAAGPWADLLAHSRVRLRKTKGVHLVIDRQRLNLSQAFVATEGKRILFAIPWGPRVEPGPGGRGGRVILGTTDTDYHGQPGDVAVDACDVAYLLDVFNRMFPRQRLCEADVLSQWAGVRPLVAGRGGGPGDLSRGHQIRSPAAGWWDVTGGKLTTYRLMGEQTVRQVLGYLGRKPGPWRTAIEPLLPPGTSAAFSSIVPPPVSRQAVEHYCLREWANHLDDVMIRRTSWHYYLPDACARARQVGQWMAGLLGWDDRRLAQEHARYQQL